MRRSRLLIISLLVVAAGTLLAQDENPINGKLTADLNKKLPETGSMQLVWTPTRLGYFTRFTIDNVEYMVMYDKQGSYKTILQKKPWDDRIPENIRLEFGNSPYSLCSVATFWETIQSNNKEFYLELIDREGKSMSAWFDENGKFFDQPSFYR